jgi:hypothetical protein
VLPLTSDPSAPFSKLKDHRSIKSCLDKLHSAQDLWPGIRLPSIRLHGIRLHGTRPHDNRLLSISGINGDLFLLIRMTKPRLRNQARAASLAKMENRKAVPNRNVLRAGVMVAPLDFIAEIIRDNHWGYLYNCACTVYPRLVKEFYGYLEVIL